MSLMVLAQRTFNLMCSGSHPAYIIKPGLHDNKGPRSILGHAVQRVQGIQNGSMYIKKALSLQIDNFYSV